MRIMDSETAREIGKKGAIASAEARKQTGKTFEDVVRENITNQDLKELYKGMLESGKKGNVKAVETILKYLEIEKEPQDNFDDF